MCLSEFTLALFAVVKITKQGLCQRVPQDRRGSGHSAEIEAADVRVGGLAFAGVYTDDVVAFFNL